MLRFETMSLEFSELDPFPLFPSGKYSYDDEKQHSVLVDKWLGFDVENIEKNILNNQNYKSSSVQEYWAGLPIQSMQTPYSELRFIFSLLPMNEMEKVVDLGCAYGRMAFVLERHHQGLEFLGIEYVVERVNEGRRVFRKNGLKSSRILEEKLGENYELPEGDLYFVYDFGSEIDIQETLLRLQEIAKRKSIFVVGRGGRSRHLIHQNHPWLAQVNKPLNFNHFSIYRS